MSTTATTSILPGPKGTHLQQRRVQQSPRKRSFTLPEYLEAHQVQAVISAAPNPRARLLMLLQWRAGLRVSEALALEVADLSLDSDQPTIRVREGKGKDGAAASYRYTPSCKTPWALSCTSPTWGKGAYSPSAGHGLALGPGRHGAGHRPRWFAPRKTDWDPHFPPLLCPSSAAPRGANQLPEPVAGPQIHANYVGLSGAGA